MPIYMKYEGIQGTGKGKYSGWIELEGCQIGSPNRGGSVINFEVIVTKFLDNSSSRLVQEALSGTGKKVTIDFVMTGESVPYMSIELENVIITSYQVNGTSDPDRPMETLSLNYTKISYSVKPTKPSNDPKQAQQKATWNSAIQNSRYS